MKVSKAVLSAALLAVTLGLYSASAFAENLENNSTQHHINYYSKIASRYNKLAKRFYQLAGLSVSSIQLGPRPFFLVNDMEESELKDSLQACSGGPFYKTDFSIGHRGAALQFPEHTQASYEAAAQMGAGIIECDVTFTKDKELVCRHSQCDLHATTNILAIPELAEKCSIPPDFNSESPFSNVQCCTSDINLAEFKSLKGKMDASNPQAATLNEYLNATANFRTDLYSANASVMTHKESIELFKKLGVKMTPELKSPSVQMPFNGFSQQDYAQKMLDEYKDAGVQPSHVFAQSFNLDDVKYWLENEPEFGKQVVYLDGRYDDETFDHTAPSTWFPNMNELVDQGVKIIAPPMWMLVKIENGKIAPSAYAVEAKAASLEIITWTLERSGLLNTGGSWYYQTITDNINTDGDTFELLDVLAKQVKVRGIFSDWAAPVTYYANCMDL